MTPLTKFSLSTSRRSRMPALVALLMLAGSTFDSRCSCCIDAFQLSMVASRIPFGVPGRLQKRQKQKQYQRQHLHNQQEQEQKRRRQLSSSQVDGRADITSSLVSQLTAVALKLRLQESADVSCDVLTSTFDMLLHGRVGPVSVRGKGWSSRLGLSCRAIDATVDACDLDVGRILSQRKLCLTRPAKGKAMVALDATDFVNFINHPLIRPPSLPSSDSETIDRHDHSRSGLVFKKEGASIDPLFGTVVFHGLYRDMQWKFTLRRAGAGVGQRAIVVAECDGRDANGVEVVSAEDRETIAAQLSAVVSRFFNEMVLNLGGTSLSFEDMMVTENYKKPSLMLALGILVRKFPSSSLNF